LLIFSEGDEGVVREEVVNVLKRFKAAFLVFEVTDKLSFVGCGELEGKSRDQSFVDCSAANIKSLYCLFEESSVNYS